MAEDKGFRPHRKPIDPNEVNAENQAKLNEISQIQRMAAEEVGEQVPPGGLQNAGIQITGHVPPAFQQMQQRGPRTRPAPTADANAGEMPYDYSGGETYQAILAQIKKAKSIYEEIQLPSKGKFYDGADGPRNGKLHVRPMTGREEEILATSRLVKKGQAMNMIFKNCLQEDLNPEAFLTEDRTYLLIYLRGISYTPQYDVEVKCPECDHRFSTVINLNELYVDECPEDFTPASMRDTLPVSQIPFTYRLSRGEDEQRVQDYRERKSREPGATDDTLLYRSAQLLEDFGGIKDKNEILQLLKQLPIGDVAHIRNTISEPPFGVDTDVDIYCPGCLQEFTIDLPLEADFFFPRKKKKKSDLMDK